MRALIAAALAAASTYQAAAADIAQFEPLRLNSEYVRWFPNQAGKISLTYAIADRDVVTPEATNCRRMRSPATVLNTATIDRARFEQVLRGAFDSWQRAANIVFTQTRDTDAADILIGEQIDPNGYAFTSVLPGSQTANGFREITKAAICFNPLQQWKDGRGGDPRVYDLSYTLKHEIGHVIGLDHPSRRGALMSFRYSEDVGDLTPGDIAGAAYIYGPAQQPGDLMVVPARAEASNALAR